MIKFRLAGFVAVMVAGCGSSGVAIPPGSTMGEMTGVGAAATIPSEDWMASTLTGTGNALSVVLAPAGVKGVGLPGGAAPVDLRVTYVDRTGYFVGRTTLNAWIALLLRDSRRVEVGAISLNRVAQEGEREAVFVAVSGLPAEVSGAEVRALEVAVSSSDRYGHLRWDSNEGRNYRLARD